MNHQTLPHISDEEWDKCKQMARDWCLLSLGSDSMMPHLWVWSVRDLHPNLPKDETPDSPRFSDTELFMAALAVDWPAGREQAFLSVATKLYQERRIPVALMFMSEAWQSQRKPEDMFSNRPQVMPRDDPNRKEILQCTGLRLVDKEGRMLRKDGALAWGWSMLVTRDADNKMVKGDEPMESDEHAALLLYRFMSIFAMVVLGLVTPDPDVDASLHTPEQMIEELKRKEQ